MHRSLSTYYLPISHFHFYYLLFHFNGMQYKQYNAIYLPGRMASTPLLVLLSISLHVLCMQYKQYKAIYLVNHCITMEPFNRPLSDDKSSINIPANRI